MVIQLMAFLVGSPQFEMIPDLVLALVDKSLSILDNNGLKYKMKVEVCKLLQLFALKMIQTPEEF